MEKARSSNERLYDLTTAIHLLLGYIKMNFLIPGRAETWVIIFDFNKINTIKYIRNGIK